MELFNAILTIVIRSACVCTGGRVYYTFAVDYMKDVTIPGGLVLGNPLNLQIEDTNRVLLHGQIAAKSIVNILMHFPPAKLFYILLVLLSSR